METNSLQPFEFVFVFWFLLYMHCVQSQQSQGEMIQGELQIFLEYTLQGMKPDNSKMAIKCFSNIRTLILKYLIICTYLIEHGT